MSRYNHHSDDEDSEGEISTPPPVLSSYAMLANQPPPPPVARRLDQQRQQQQQAASSSWNSNNRDATMNTTARSSNYESSLDRGGRTGGRGDGGRMGGRHGGRGPGRGRNESSGRWNDADDRSRRSNSLASDEGRMGRPYDSGGRGGRNGGRLEDRNDAGRGGRGQWMERGGGGAGRGRDGRGDGLRWNDGRGGGRGRGPRDDMDRRDDRAPPFNAGRNMNRDQGRGGSFQGRGGRGFRDDERSSSLPRDRREDSHGFQSRANDDPKRFRSAPDEADASHFPKRSRLDVAQSFGSEGEISDSYVGDTSASHLPERPPPHEHRPYDTYRARQGPGSSEQHFDEPKSFDLRSSSHENISRPAMGRSHDMSSDVVGPDRSREHFPRDGPDQPLHDRPKDFRMEGQPHQQIRPKTNVHHGGQPKFQSANQRDDDFDNWNRFPREDEFGPGNPNRQHEQPLSSYPPPPPPPPPAPHSLPPPHVQPKSHFQDARLTAAPPTRDEFGRSKEGYAPQRHGQADARPVPGPPVDEMRRHPSNEPARFQPSSQNAGPERRMSSGYDGPPQKDPHHHHGQDHYGPSVGQGGRGGFAMAASQYGPGDRMHDDHGGRGRGGRGDFDGRGRGRGMRGRGRGEFGGRFDGPGRGSFMAGPMSRDGGDRFSSFGDMNDGAGGTLLDHSDRSSQYGPAGGRGGFDARDGRGPGGRGPDFDRNLPRHAFDGRGRGRGDAGRFGRGLPDMRRNSLGGHSDNGMHDVRSHGYGPHPPLSVNVQHPPAGRPMPNFSPHSPTGSYTGLPHSAQQFTEPNEFGKPMVDEAPLTDAMEGVTVIDMDNDVHPEPEVQDVVRPTTPPPKPSAPSARVLALTRLLDLETQMEFAFAKQMLLVRKQKLLRVQYDVLKDLPVGIDAIMDDLAAYRAKHDETASLYEDAAV